MLDYQRLQSSLADVQCYAIRESGFEGLKYLSRSNERFICGEGEALRQGIALPNQFSFWVCDAQDIAFVGLWNGLIYLLPDENRLQDLCHSLCALPGRAAEPLSRITAEVSAAFSLSPVELLHLAASEASNWEDARYTSRIPESVFSEFLENLSRTVTRIEYADNGKVDIYLGDAHCITRLPTEPCVDYATLVFIEGLRETTDQVKLLHAIRDASGLTLFDGSWGNLVRLEDHYYSIPSGNARPDEPSNWTE